MKDILLKEKITKRVFSPVRNKEAAAFHSVFLFLHENSEICEWKEVDGIWVRITGETGRMVVWQRPNIILPYLSAVFLLRIDNNFSGHMGPVMCLWGGPRGHAANSSPWDVGQHVPCASSGPGLRSNMPSPSPSPLALVEMWPPCSAVSTTGMRPSEGFGM